MKVAIRDDDTSYFTKPADLQKAYDFLSDEDCVSLSVVPYTVPVHRGDVYPYGKKIAMDYYDIAKNMELLEYLKDLLSTFKGIISYFSFPIFPFK